jgi:hypothetical protein
MAMAVAGGALVLSRLCMVGILPRSEPWKNGRRGWKTNLWMTNQRAAQDAIVANGFQ